MITGCAAAEPAWFLFQNVCTSAVHACEVGKWANQLSYVPSQCCYSITVDKDVFYIRTGELSYSPSYRADTRLAVRRFARQRAATFQIKIRYLWYLKPRAERRIVNKRTEGVHLKCRRAYIGCLTPTTGDRFSPSASKAYSIEMEG